MEKKVASFVLKIMLMWMLALVVLSMCLSIRQNNMILGVELTGGMFLGAFFAGAIISIVAVVIMGLKKGRNSVTNARSNYAGAGMMLAVFGILMMVIQYCYGPMMVWIFGEDIVNASWYSWVQTIVSTYVLTLGVVTILAGTVEKSPIERHKMKIGQFICCIFMNAGIVAVGATVGALLEALMLFRLGTTGGGGQVISNMMIGSNDFWRILTVGIGAPIVEELVFRKFLIDRVHKYGEGIAIFISGLLFGLFHGNFSQVFFATGVGLFFAYIYVRTGNIWYSILLHMVVNLSSSVVSIMLIERLDYDLINKYVEMEVYSPEAMEIMMQLMPNMLPLILWVLLLIIAAIIGLILWILNRKKFYLVKSEEYVEKKKLRTAFGNYGMIYFLLLCLYRFFSFYV